MAASILWFRRDLRLSDHPALLAAGATGEVVPVFVLDPALLRPAGPRRVAFLLGALADLHRRTGGALRVVTGDPATVLPRLAEGLEAVHISSDHAPYGRARDAAVRAGLGDTPLVETGSPYGVTPGRLRKADHSPYRVFTPFHRAWQEHGLRRPATGPEPRWSDGGLPTEPLPPAPGVEVPAPTEAAAQERWEEFRAEGLADYARARNSAEGTSRLSPYLRWGLLHPRTLHEGLHAGLDGSDGAQTFGRELVWRDFYADVLWHQPQTAREDLQPIGVEYDEPGAAFDAWREGRTGYPYVDAGMRQLRVQGWLPNRTRMVVASFLTKDLHVHWWHGARHFMAELVDADLASNQHGWQWVAGTGTDASPYHRVFNPVTQGKAHDPDGAYVRRWVPELAHLPAPAIHEPWTLEHLPDGYPPQVVDHAQERVEALDRYQRRRA